MSDSDILYTIIVLAVICVPILMMLRSGDRP